MTKLRGVLKVLGQAGLMVAVIALPVAMLSLHGPGAQAQIITAPRWECSLDDLGATLTRCIAASTGGESRYITDIIAQSTTTTAGLMLLRRGTGSNCATDTISVFPSAASVARFAYQANTAAPTVISLTTPLRVPPDKDLCVIGTAVNTASVQLVGYLAP